MPTADESSNAVYTDAEKTDMQKMIKDGLLKPQYEQELRKSGVSPDRIAYLSKEFARISFYQIYKHAEKVFTETSSVDNWSTLLDFNEKHGIIVHKQRGMILPDKTGTEWCGIENLAFDDFMFGLMSMTQQRTFLEFGKTVILEWVAKAKTKVCALYVLVLDNKGHDLPVGFCVANNDDMTAVRCFFYGIKQFCGRVPTDFLILNNLKLYEIWAEVFIDDGQKVDYFISPWHSLNNFTAILNQSQAPKLLSNSIRDLFSKALVESDQTQFDNLVSEIVHLLQSDNTLINVFNHWSNELKSEHESWAPCFFPSQIHIIFEASRIFHPNAVKKLHNFTRRKVGRCVYLIIQFQRHKAKKTQSLKATGKKRNPFSSAPALDRFFHPNNGNEENVEYEVENICDEDRIVGPSVTKNRKRKLNEMVTENGKSENTGSDIFNITNPDEFSNIISIDKEERSMEIVKRICCNLLDNIDSISEAGLDIMNKKLKGVIEMFPSQDQEGNIIEAHQF